MRSYLEILTELKETIESDVSMPDKEKAVAIEYVNQLLTTLWPYSD